MTLFNNGISSKGLSKTFFRLKKKKINIDDLSVTKKVQSQIYDVDRSLELE